MEMFFTVEGVIYSTQHILSIKRNDAKYPLYDGTEDVHIVPRTQVHMINGATVIVKEDKDVFVKKMKIKAIEFEDDTT